MDREAVSSCGGCLLLIVVICLVGYFVPFQWLAGRAYTEVLIASASGTTDDMAAIEQLSIAIDWTEDSTEALQARANRYENRKEWSKALADLDRLIELSATSDAYLSRARIRQQLNEMESALSDANQAIDRDASTAAYAVRASINRQRNNINAAIDDYSKCLELEPESGENAIERGLLFLEHGEFARARQDFTTSLGIQSDPKAFYYRALAASELEDFNSALADLTKLVDQTFGISAELLGDARLERIRCYALLGKPDLALPDIRVMERQRPESGRLHLWASRVWSTKRAYDKSIEYAQLARRFLTTGSDDWRQASIELGMNFEASNRLKDAVDVYQSLLKEHPASSDQVLVRFAAIDIVQNNLASAEEKLLRATQASSTLESAFILAQLRIRQENWAEADQLLSRVVAGDEGYETALYDHGFVLQKLGNHRQSIRLLKRWLERNPYDAKAYLTTANSCLAIKRYVEAGTQLQRGIASLSRSSTDEELRREIVFALAWLRATCPIKEARNGPQALSLATEVADLDGWESATSLTAIAAAYAEVGEFATAVERQRVAIELGSQEIPLEKLREQLQAYEQNKPFRDSPPQRAESQLEQN